MLEPDSRHLLLDALRPPDGYSMDLAVGTTYSLDLGALLTAPLAFAMFDAVGADPTGIGPLALLEAARRHADRMTLFCQAGGIALPRRRSPALVYLERSVVEVRRPAPERVFHPKLWVLRYRASDGPLLHRVLCLSRNLTFDRSWDLVLRLDEQPGSGAVGSQPLGAFLMGLPGLALRAMPRARLGMVNSLAASVAGAGFAPPEGFDQLEFWPLGGPAGRGWPFPNTAEQVLVVSPFLTVTMLNRIAAGASRATLVSRPESIDELGEPALRCYGETFVVSELADPAADDATAAAAADQPPDPVEETADVAAGGLHAKAYVADHSDQGSASTVWVGSANATHAAFSGNIEFLVALTGPTRRCGVQACLGAETDPQALRRLLVPYPPPAHPLPPSPEQQAQDQLEGLGIDMAVAGGTLTVGPASDTDGLPRYPLTLQLAQPPAGTRARAWPVTLPPSVGARTIDPVAGTATWDAVAAETITPFIAVELAAASAEGGPSATTFVLIADLIGAPADRQVRVLASIVQTSQDFLRYLLLLLADSGINTDAWLGLQEQLAGDPGRHTRRGWSGGFPVLEALLRTLSRDPDALDHVARLVDDLGRAPDGTAVIPEDFQLIWDPVRSVRQARRR